MCILINYIVYCNLDSCVWSKLFYLNSLLALHSFFFNYCLSVSLSVCQSISVCLSICLSTCLSLCLSVYLSLSLSVCLSVSLSVSVCLCLLERLSSPFPYFMQLGTQSYYFLVSIYLILSYFFLHFTLTFFISSFFFFYTTFLFFQFPPILTYSFI